MLRTPILHGKTNNGYKLHSRQTLTLRRVYRNKLFVFVLYNYKTSLLITSQYQL